MDSKGVCLEIQDSRSWEQSHSASTRAITGTTDWQYVENVYQTLPDAEAVNIIARRIGEEGPLKGKALFKDVRLEKFIPSIDTKIPYLSVNVSKNNEGSKIYLMVINKNMDESIASTIYLKNFIGAKEANAWILNGPSVDATNEKNPDNVTVRPAKFGIQSSQSEGSSSFSFSFEPHSITAIEIEKLKQ
jgi:alpha-L-arabinofuranosidase